MYILISLLSDKAEQVFESWYLVHHPAGSVIGPSHPLLQFESSHRSQPGHVRICRHMYAPSQRLFACFVSVCSQPMLIILMSAALIIPDNGVFSLYSTTHLSSLTPYTALPEAAWNAVLSLSGTTSSSNVDCTTVCLLPSSHLLCYAGLVMPSWRGISQRLILPLSSDNLWSVTPESLALLNSSLVPNTGITIQITQVFTRPGPPNYQTVSLQNSVTLSESAIAELVGRNRC